MAYKLSGQNKQLVLSSLALLMLRPLDRFDVDALLEHLPQRGHLAEPVDLSDRPLDRKVDLFLGRETPDAEPEKERTMNICIMSTFIFLI